MRLTLPSISILAALLASDTSLAQTPESGVVLSAYNELPTNNSNLTIVPPGATIPLASVQAPAPVPTPAPVPMERVLTTTQPWTPEDVGCAQAICSPPHSIRAEPWDGGWFGAIELTILSPTYDDLPVSDRDLSVGPRLVLGWESDRGFGIRGRVWGLETNSEIAFPLGMTVDHRLQASRFDFDLYREFDFSGSSVTVGGSITAAELEGKIDSFAPSHDAGGGLGFFVEGRHLLSKSYESEWAVIARGRWAGLVGTWEDPNSGLPLSSGDSTMEILEAGLGWEWERKFDGWSFVLQHTIELQRWDTSYVSDVSFFGQTVSLGFDW